MSETDSRPTRFGDWIVESQLGTGTFSSVMLVRRQSDGAEGALKTADRSLPATLDRLTVEAQTLPLFDYVGIPRLLDEDLDYEVPYIVMSRAPGETLLDRIARYSATGAVHGEIEAAEITLQLLKALAHVHGREMVHRDIKDANIMYDGRSVTLIDFGFCKRIGQRDQQSRDSFWRVGAARFAPLGKLNDHTLGKPRQDVFGVGVLAYLLTTGAFPWGDESDGLTLLRQRYGAISPVPVHELNRLVSPFFSRLVSRMLEMEDDKRIPTHEAVDELEILLPDIREYALGKMGPFHGRSIRAKRAVYPHVVRDPVAGDVRVTDYEFRVMNTREMQRLRWIRQLGLTNLVYPGADHSRLSHSIGAVASAERMLRAIEDESGERIDSQVRSVTRLHALTHDVTHISMGHTIEDQLGFFVRHDRNQGRYNRLVAHADSELGEVLDSSQDGSIAKAMLDPARLGEFADGVPFQVVSGDMGADLLDYLDRDAYFCGLDHRVDTAVYRQLAIDGPAYSDVRQIVSRISGKYGVRTDRGFAIDSLLNERYAMFLKVYNHSAKITADAVLDKALRTLGVRSLSEEKFEQFGDEALLSFLIASRRDHVRALGEMLRGRRLPRGVFRARVAEDFARRGTAPQLQEVRSYLTDANFLSAEGRAAVEARIAKEARVNAAQVFFYLPSSAPGYKRAQLWVTEGAARSRHQATGDLPRRHLNLWELWVFVDSKDPRERTAVANAAQALTGFTNVIRLDDRETHLI